jgi:MraZ protein
MLLLTGEYDLSLDEKNRLVVPTRVREEIAQDGHGSVFYLSLGTNRVLSLYPERIYQRIALVVAPGKAAPDEALRHDRLNYSLASKVELDRQGRLLLGERYVSRSGLKEQVTMIGAKDHLEIWDPQQWGTFLAENFGVNEQAMLLARQQVLHEEYNSAVQNLQAELENRPDATNE